MRWEISKVPAGYFFGLDPQDFSQAYARGISKKHEKSRTKNLDAKH